MNITWSIKMNVSLCEKYMLIFAQTVTYPFSSLRVLIE